MKGSFHIKTLIKLRESKLLTQQQIAKEIGISYITWHLIENNKSFNPSLAILNKICSYFNVGLDYIFKQDC